MKIFKEQKEELERVIIFTKTKWKADKVAQHLDRSGIPSESICSHTTNRRIGYSAYRECCQDCKASVWNGRTPNISVSIPGMFRWFKGMARVRQAAVDCFSSTASRALIGAHQQAKSCACTVRQANRCGSTHTHTSIRINTDTTTDRGILPLLMAATFMPTA